MDEVLGPFEKQILDWAQARKYQIGPRQWGYVKGVIAEAHTDAIKEEFSSYEGPKDYRQSKLDLIGLAIPPPDISRKINYGYGNLTYEFKREHNSLPLNSDAEVNAYLIAHKPHTTSFFWTIDEIDAKGYMHISTYSNILFEAGISFPRAKRATPLRKLLAAASVWGNEYANYSIELPTSGDHHRDVQSVTDFIDVYKIYPLEFDETWKRKLK
jgi:hypothetical protein